MNAQSFFVTDGARVKVGGMGMATEGLAPALDEGGPGGGMNGGGGEGRSEGDRATLLNKGGEFSMYDDEGREVLPGRPNGGREEREVAATGELPSRPRYEGAEMVGEEDAAAGTSGGPRPPPPPPPPPFLAVHVAEAVGPVEVEMTPRVEAGREVGGFESQRQAPGPGDGEGTPAGAPPLPTPPPLPPRPAADA
jgi:hypothetical protein